MAEPTIMQVESDERPCPDTECGNQVVEPEVDGDHRYYECEDCGMAFGYERIETGVRVEGNCAIGVPESVRRQASGGMEKAIADEARAQPVDIGLSIGRRPGL